MAPATTQTILWVIAAVLVGCIALQRTSHRLIGSLIAVPAIAALAAIFYFRGTWWVAVPMTVFALWGAFGTAQQLRKRGGDAR